MISGYMAINEDKLHQHLETAVTDSGATFHASLVVIGDKLDLYRALDKARPLTSEALVERTDTAERYVRKWLNAQAADGYVTYDSETDRYSLSEEQATMLANEDTLAFVPGTFQVAISSD